MTQGAIWGSTTVSQEAEEEEEKWGQEALLRFLWKE